MLRKTFYTIFAIGAMITLGVLSSGFTATNKTIAEAETPVAGKWIAGAVDGEGKVTEAGTGGWTIKYVKIGVYEVQGPANAKIMVATSINPHHEYDPYYDTSYIHVENMGNGLFLIKSLTPHKHAWHSTLLRDSGFSFVMYAQ